MDLSSIDQNNPIKLPIYSRNHLNIVNNILVYYSITSATFGLISINLEYY